jgi:hypothetical protein
VASHLVQQSCATDAARAFTLVRAGFTAVPPTHLPETLEPVEKVRREDSSVRCLDEPPDFYSCIALSLHVFLTLFISLAFVAVGVV